MKALKFLNFGFLAISIFFATHATLSAQNKSSFEDSVDITIDKTSTDEDFETIKAMLQEYNVDVEFSNVKRNENNEIIGLSIMLSSNNGQQTSSSISSNRPINKISFGSKNGALYIGQGQGRNSILGLGNSNSFSMPFDLDSIFGSNGIGFRMDDFFNGNSNLFFFDNDSLNSDDLKKRFQQHFKNNRPNNFSFSFSNDDDTSQRYRFIDNPDKETLIVIDGEISDFKTLDHLAKTNKLADVDVLKAETAMSIYGNKAKDGAISIYTKDNYQRSLEERKKYAQKYNSEVTASGNVENTKPDDAIVLYFISKITPNSLIEQHINQLKSAGITAKVSKLKRNNKGEITKIKIRLSDNSGNNSEAVFSNNKGISTIKIGKQGNTLVVSSEKF